MRFKLNESPIYQTKLISRNLSQARAFRHYHFFVELKHTQSTISAVHIIRSMLVMPLFSSNGQNYNFDIRYLHIFSQKLSKEWNQKGDRWPYNSKFNKTSSVSENNMHGTGFNIVTINFLIQSQ